MTRKLHNTISALFATSGLLVLSLMAASPIPAASPWSSTADLVQVDASTHRAEATAAAIEANANALEARIEASASAAEAVAHVAAFTAEATTTAVLVEALNMAEADDNSEPAPQRARSKPRRSHQSVAMPFFSFAPRG